jgi:Sir2 family
MLAQRIFILTGAGVSAESGLSTFRDKGGIWAQYNIEEVASIQGYERDREKVLAFYNMRRNTHRGVEPNAAHIALAQLQARWAPSARRTSTICMSGAVPRACCTCTARSPRRVAMNAERSRPTRKISPPTSGARRAVKLAGCGRTWSGSARRRCSWTKSMRRWRRLICSSRSARQAMSTQRQALFHRRAGPAFRLWKSISNHRKTLALSMLDVTGKQAKKCRLGLPN